MVLEEKVIVLGNKANISERYPQANKTILELESSSASADPRAESSRLRVLGTRLVLVSRRPKVERCPIRPITGLSVFAVIAQGAANLAEDV